MLINAAKTEDSLKACAPTCHVLLCISYMDGKIIKSIFTSNKRFVFWTSEERVIAVLLKTTQKLSRRARIWEDSLNASTSWPSTFQRGDLCSYPARRVVPSIYTPLLLSIERTFWYFNKPIYENYSKTAECLAPLLLWVLLDLQEDSFGIP